MEKDKYLATNPPPTTTSSKKNSPPPPSRYVAPKKEAAPTQSGGTFVSDRYGNMVKVGEGTGSGQGGQVSIGATAEQVRTGQATITIEQTPDAMVRQYEARKSAEQTKTVIVDNKIFTVPSSAKVYSGFGSGFTEAEARQLSEAKAAEIVYEQRKMSEQLEKAGYKTQPQEILKERAELAQYGAEIKEYEKKKQEQGIEKQQTPIESARAYYTGEPFQIYGQTFVFAEQEQKRPIATISAATKSEDISQKQPFQSKLFEINPKLAQYYADISAVRPVAEEYFKDAVSVPYGLPVKPLVQPIKRSVGTFEGALGINRLTPVIQKVEQGKLGIPVLKPELNRDIAVGTLFAASQLNPYTKAASLIVGTVFAGILLKQTMDEPRPLKLIAEQTPSLATQIASGGLAARLLTPKGMIEITKAKTKDVRIVESIDFEKGLGKQGITIEVQKRIVPKKIEVEPFEQRVSPPKSPEKMVDFMLREDITSGFKLGEKGLEPAYYLQRARTSRTRDTQPQPFKAEGRAEIEQTFIDESIEMENILESASLTETAPLETPQARIIDPREFNKDIKGNQMEMTRDFQYVRAQMPEQIGDIKLTSAKLDIKGKVVEVYKAAKVFFGAETLGVKLGSLFPKIIIEIETALKGRKQPIISATDISPKYPKLGIASFVDVEEGISARARLIETEITEGENKSISPPRLSSRIEERQKSLFGAPISERTSITLDSELIPEPSKPSPPILDVKFEARQKQDLIPVPKFDLEIKIPEITEETRKTPIILDISKKSGKIGESEGYIPEVKEKGKFIRVSKEIMTREDALSMAARIADTTTAATIRAKKIQTNAPPIPKFDNYFSENKYKFREYHKSYKGKKQAELPSDTYIEKRKFRIDTSGEREGLTANKSIKLSLGRSNLLKESAGGKYGKFGIL